MFKICITGGIGSGKTLVCKVFEHLGIPVYYADYEAKQLYDTDELLRQQITGIFGAELYEEGKLNRKMLASIIFNDKTALDKVNKLVHPAVERSFIAWADKQCNVPYVIQEAAIVFESGLAYMFDKIINISAPIELRIRRASNRDNVPAEEIRRRISNQMADEERNNLADYVITSNDIEPILPQILTIHQTLINLSKEGECS